MVVQPHQRETDKLHHIFRFFPLQHLECFTDFQYPGFLSAQVILEMAAHKALPFLGICRKSLTGGWKQNVKKEKFCIHLEIWFQHILRWSEWYCSISPVSWGKFMMAADRELSILSNLIMVMPFFLKQILGLLFLLKLSLSGLDTNSNHHPKKHMLFCSQV